MQIIISPAKQMREDLDTLAPQSTPMFLEQAGRLLSALQAMSPQELQVLWRCNASIAAQNIRRLEVMDLGRNLTPALLSYVGIQYQTMAPGVFEAGQYQFLQRHLRILSGFYGLLRPFDGVTPYRLEMQAKLSVDGNQDLYSFWAGQLAQALASEDSLLLNLASREYSRAVLPHLPPSVRVITCIFGELCPDGSVLEKGTRCKMARGQMVRWLAENAVQQPEDLPAFQGLGYQYDPVHSRRDSLVFLLPKPSGHTTERKDCNASF